MSDRLGTYPPTRATARARQLRQYSTHPEKLLWSVLRNRRLGGLKFRRQVPIGPFVVDFFCEEKSLVVEIDGVTHDVSADYDAQRTKYLNEHRLRVVRVTNGDVLNSLEGVMWLIAREAGVELADRKPSPLPVSQGERGAG